MRLIVVVLAIAASSAQGPGERPGNWGSGGSKLTTWIILKHNLEMTVWLDTARIRRHSPDSSMDVWLRYAAAHTTALSDFQGAARFKTMDIEATVRCSDQVVRAWTVAFWDSTGKLMATVPVGPAHGAASAMSEPVRTVLPLLCTWLIKAHLIPPLPQ